MSGMIWNAIGEGIGSVGNSVTNYLARNAEREDRQEERRRELEERRAYERDRDEKYRRTAEQQSAGRGPSGPTLLTDDEQAAIAVGQGAVSGRPEYDALWNSVKTGDRSAFKKGVEREVDVPNPENPDYDSTREKRVVQEYPPGFEDVYKAKVAKLAEIRQMSVYNKDYDDVKKGERTAQEIKRSDEAIADPSRAGDIGKGMAAGEGRGGYKVQGNTLFNEFTGDTKSTEVGESIQDRNRRAPQGKPAAATNLKDMPTERLEKQQDTLRKAIDKASGDRRKMLEDEFDAITGVLRSRRQPSSGASPSASNPAGPSMPAPKTQAEFDKLPKGARFLAPDGSTRIK